MTQATHSPRLLRLLRWASLTEGATLVLLVCLAVPLKRLMGMPEAVSLMGPVHGAAFLGYMALVVRASAAQWLTPRETQLMLLVAFIPFGALFVAKMLKAKTLPTDMPHPTDTFTTSP